MRLTKYGHSCLLVEEGPARLLLDPGTLSGGFEELEGLTAVLVTHQHADHLDLQRLRTLLDRNPGARVLCDEGSAEQLAAAGAVVEVVHDGEELDVGGVAVRVSGRDHAVIHPDIPVVPNVGYLVGGRLFHRSVGARWLLKALRKAAQLAVRPLIWTRSMCPFPGVAEDRIR